MERMLFGPVGLQALHLAEAEDAEQQNHNHEHDSDGEQDAVAHVAEEGPEGSAHSANDVHEHGDAGVNLGVLTLAEELANGSSASYSGSVSGWVNPAPGKYVTSGFGWRPSIGDFHQGVDLSSSYEPVYCMADGTVTTAGWFGTGGIAVTVDHGGGLVTWYLHNSQVLVSVGQHVSAGQQISISGSTGFSTGPHLHFQINTGCSNGVTGTAVNPAAYFSW